MSYSAVLKLVDDLEVIKQRTLVATNASDAGDVLAALDGLKRSVDGFPFSVELTCVWHLRRAELLMRLGQAVEAGGHARAGRAALGHHKKTHLRIDCAMREAEAADALGDMDALDRITVEGIALAESRRHSVRAPYLKAGYLRDCIGLYALGIKAALSRGDLDQALARAEVSKARIDRIEDAAGAEDLRAQLREQSAQITALEQRGGDTTQARATRRALWDSYLRTTEVTAPVPVTSVAQVQACLSADEAVLFYFWIDPHTLLRVALNPVVYAFDTVAVAPPDRQALLAYIDRISTAPRGKNVAEITAFRALLWPEAGPLAAVLDGARRLIISPHRMLHRLPLHAIQLKGQHVIERWAVRYVPGLAALLQPAPQEARRGMLSVGIGAYHGANAALKPLRKAATEADAVAARYAGAGWDVASMTADITEAGLAKAIARVDPGVFHIACHGANVDADTPLESHLYLTDTRLDGLDIPLLGLSASTVFLSACSTGQRAISGRKILELPGDDMHGLMTAFFGAGASDVIGTLFHAMDRAAVQIAPAFHADMLAGAPADVALARAVRAYLAHPDNIGPFAKPDYWAPFFLVSLGSRHQQGEN